MHELAITQSVLDIARNAAEEHGVKRVTEVYLKIGDYSGVVPACIHYYFDLISRGTVAEGANIIIEPIPVTVRCRDCGQVRHIEKTKIRCPDCGSRNLTLLTGREFYVDRLEAD